MEDTQTNAAHRQQPDGTSGMDDEQFRIWDSNHQKIMAAITKPPPFFENDYVLTVSEISKLTGLSRKCVYEHLNRASDHPASRQLNQLFNSIEPEILMKIARKAMKGDLQAAKLYLQLTGKIENKTSRRKVIQDNNTGESSPSGNDITG